MAPRRSPRRAGPAALVASAALALLAAALAPRAARALTADQVGVIDWHAQGIGEVAHVLLPAARRRHAYVAGASGALACIELKTGELAWRHVLDDGDEADALTWAGGALVSLSGGGKHLRAWAPEDGTLLWETLVYGGDEAAQDPRRTAVALLALRTDADRDGEPDLAVLSAGGVSVHSAVDGELVWASDAATKLAATDARPVAMYQPLVEGSGADALVVAALADVTSGAAGTLEALRYDVQLGDIERSASQRLPKEVATGAGLAVAGQGTALVGVSAAGDALVVATAEAAGKKIKAAQYPLAGIVDTNAPGSRVAAHALGEDAPAGAIGLRARGADGSVVSGAVLSVSAAAPPRVIHAVPAGAAATAAVIAPKSAAVLGAIVDASAADATRLTVFDFSDGSIVSTMDVDGRGGAAHGGAVLATLSVYTRKDGSAGYRCVLASEDHSLALMQQGVVAWEREEALASIVTAHFVELPVDESAGAVPVASSRSPDELWRMQVLNMKLSLRLATRAEYEELQVLRAADPSKTNPHRDPVGLRQLIVCLTAAGKVFGLHSGDGRALWSAYLGAGAAGDGALRAVLPWREGGEDGTEHELLALGAVPGGATTRAMWIRASDGAVLAEEVLPIAATRAIPLAGEAFEGSRGERPVLLVGASGELHLVGVTRGDAADPIAAADAREALASRASKVFYYESDEVSGEIRGYGLVPDAAAAVGVRRAPLWQLTLPPSERMEAVVERTADAVHTQVKVLGDRSALYKYLGPNTAAVFATAVRAQDDEDGAESGADASVGSATVVPGLVVYILDTATGRVLYRTLHLGSSGPVQAAFYENWVVYHYWSEEAMRNEMSVLELFDDTRDRPSHIKEGIMRLLGAEVEAPTSSSHSLPPLRVLAQTYYIPMSARAMAATSTAQGVTARQVLLGTGTDQVLALDRRLLDPRRPLKPTAASKEERLPPYSEMLPVDPRRMLTHKHTVAKLRLIEVAPTHLESTCLVFAVGLDRYLTRLAPSRSYDTISDSFNYLLLTVTVVGMVVATLVASKLAHRKDLARRWK